MRHTPFHFTCPPFDAKSEEETSELTPLIKTEVEEIIITQEVDLLEVAVDVEGAPQDASPGKQSSASGGLLPTFSLSKIGDAIKAKLDDLIEEDEVAPRPGPAPTSHVTCRRVTLE